jgi:hypothetical protein
MNDTERLLWLDNDEGLYSWWKSSRQSKTAFIREHRKDIDAVITNVTDNKKPAHYLKYDR